MRKDNVKGIIGAIIDYGSRTGREEKVAMEMAIKDFYDYKKQILILHIKNSQREPFQAALAATDLIEKQKVLAILGPRTWEEAMLVAEVGSKDHIPILSLADAMPSWAIEKWPFLVQASPNQYMQMEAVAAIIKSWEWHRITVIYEDINSVSTGVIPHLAGALREVGAEISQLMALPPLTASSLPEELERLKRGQCRVFVVHLPLPLAMRLFEKAKEMGMMEKEYVWITTDTITSLVHSINSSAISSFMQGILGIRSYFPKTGQRFHDFNLRFHRRFSLEYPEEDNHEPGIFAVQAYDAIWTLALAMGESNTRDNQLLQNILLSNFHGLSTNVQFMDHKVAPAHIFQIINVIGKSYRELGFWSDGLGFSKIIDERAIYNSSMKNLGQVFWPGDPWYIPRGWILPTNANPLRIAVPTGAIYKQFVNVVPDDHSENNCSFSGFSIEVFKATLTYLPYYLPYKFIPFNGSYDDIVEQVYLKKFDAVVGDVAIISRRYEHAEFTHPYTESGLVMVVPIQSKVHNKAWLFIKPFTSAMWMLIVIINVYNGFVVWLIERNHCSEFNGSSLNQIGILLWLSFSTLFSLLGEQLHSNLTRMAMVVWLFVALILTQSYTANLTSMLTVQQTEPTVDNVDSLLNSNAMVGCSSGSVVRAYLETVLHFKSQNIKQYSLPEEYAQALRSKEITAAFLESPWAKLFLAQFCKGFITAGPTYIVGGFGFVFPTRSPLLPDFAKALLEVSESGKLYELEKNMIGNEKCVDKDLNEETYRLSPNSFAALFIITGGTSTLALVIYVICRRWNLNDDGFMLEHRTMWRLMLAVMKHWRRQRKRFGRRVRNAETTPRTNTNAFNL